MYPSIHSSVRQSVCLSNNGVFLTGYLHFAGNGKPCPYGQVGTSLATCKGKEKFHFLVTLAHV